MFLEAVTLAFMNEYLAMLFNRVTAHTHQLCSSHLQAATMLGNTNKEVSTMARFPNELGKTHRRWKRYYEQNQNQTKDGSF